MRSQIREMLSQPKVLRRIPPPRRVFYVRHPLTRRQRRAAALVASRAAAEKRRMAWPTAPEEKSFAAATLDDLVRVIPYLGAPQAIDWDRPHKVRR